MNSNFSSKNSLSINSYEEPIFWNFALDKGRLKNFVCWFLKKHGEKKTLEFLEQLKILGFGYATHAGISLGIEDLKIPPTKPQLLAEAELVLAESALSYKRGEITGIEKMQRFIETWNETSEILKQEVVRYFEKTDILNPVYMMAFSGARGNLSQVRQLVGMRGLMSDPQGKIIDFPIQSNFREGLTLTEYLISTYGARKGIVDTALRTATAGYLTRRLVDVAQHVIVSKFDCGTQRGIFLFDMKEGVKTIYSFQTRLTGRVLAQDVILTGSLNEQKESYIAYRNQEITAELGEAISKITKKALVRSPLTCETRKLVCQLCYGWSLATSRLVSIGETVGVIAGQSIGEPGTQLTMRTFHTGGVFSANVTQQINAPFSGIVEYSHPIAGACIRLPNGTLGFLTKTTGMLFLKKYKPTDLPSLKIKEKQLKIQPILTNTYKIPAFTILFARHGQFLETNSIVAQISALPTGQKLTQTIEQTIYSPLEGEIYYSNIDILEDIDEKYGERISKAEDWSKVWVLAAKISKNNFVSPFFSKLGDYVSKSSILNEVQWLTQNSQPSFFNLKIRPQSKLNKSEYSLSLKNQVLKTQNLKMHSSSFSKLQSNSKIVFQNSANLNSGFVFSEQHQNLQEGLKSTVYISSKYKIKEKFLLTSHEVKSIKLLKKNNLNSVLTQFQKKNQNKNFLQLDTCFNYPFNNSARFNLLKILHQTFISLPVLPQGILKAWLKSEKGQLIRKTSSNFAQAKRLHLFVKNLNMNPRFRTYELTKANLFQPFTLGTLIPFTLKQKTLKNWLTSQLKQEGRQNQISEIFLFKNESLKNNRLKSETFPDQNLYKKLVLKQKNEKSFSLNQTLRNSVKKTLFNLKQSTEFQPRLFSSHKFQQLVIETPMLVLQTKNIQYRKLGYFASVLVDSNHPDQFFSSLPLELDGTIPTAFEHISQYNSKKTNFKNFNQNVQHSQNLIRQNLENLNNSYQWEPSSNSGFYWLPKTLQSSDNGVFLIYSPSRTQKNLHQFLFNFGSKLFKTLPFDKEKYANFLNFSQSQFFLKSESFKNSDQRFALRSEADKRESKTLTNKSSILKKANSIVCSSLKVKLNFSKKPVKMYLKESQKRFHSFAPNSYSYLSKSLFQRKTKELKLLKNSKFCIFKKSSSIKVSDKTSDDLKKFNEVKLSLFGKKDNLVFKSKKYFHVRLNLNEKTTVFFDEIYSLGQENYTLNCFNSKTLSAALQKNKFLFIKKRKQNFCSTKNLQFYLTNQQGLKKEFYFKNEGLLKITGANERKVKSIRKMFFNKKKYPNFLNQNFIFQKKGTALKVNHNSNQENNLKLEFFNYLQSKKFLDKTLNMNRKNLTHLNISFYNSETNQGYQSLKKFKEKSFISTQGISNFFSFIPFILKEDLVNYNKLLQKKITQFVENKENLSIQKLTLNSTLLNLSVKNGWLYKTRNFQEIYKYHKLLIEKGEVLADDISFEQQKVFVEIVRPNNNEKPTKFWKIKKNPDDKNFQIFKICKVIKNPNPRFFKISKVDETNKNGTKPSQTFKKEWEVDQSTFYLLIRPFNHQILPSNLYMKTKLYKAIKKSEKTQFDSSYSCYKNYFLPILNSQTNPLKTVSSFPLIDLQVEQLTGFPSQNLSELTHHKRYFQRKQKNSSTSKQKFKTNIQKLKKLPLKFYFDFLFKKPKINFLLQNQQKKIYQTLLGKYALKNLKITETRKLKHSKHFDNFFYLSNYPIQMSSYKVSLQSAFENRLNPKIPKISLKLNTAETSIFKNFTRTQLINLIQLKYLKILLFRSKHQNFKTEMLKKSFFYTEFELFSDPSSNGVISQKQIAALENKVITFNSRFVLPSESVSFIKQKPISLLLNSKRDQNKKRKHNRTIFINTLSIKPFLRLIADFNCFVYSYKERYNFFANQRLFASSFYKQQFKNSLNLNVLNRDNIFIENVRSKRFIQNYLNKDLFSDSRYEFNKANNQLIFQNQTLEATKTLGLTSFYSPYEGEVLKDYSSERDINNLKKSFNINLDNVHLLKTQSQQLILTKSDLFSVKLFNLNNLKKDRQNLFNNNGTVLSNNLKNSENFFNKNITKQFFEKLVDYHQSFPILENKYFEELDLNKYEISEFKTQYQNKYYRLKKMNLGMPEKLAKLRLGRLMSTGDGLYTNTRVMRSGQIIHINSEKITLRKAEFFSLSPKTILHSYNGHSILKNTAVMTLPFETLKTGDIVQGIPKVEQYLEARTTIQGRLFLNSLPVLLYAIYQRYASKLNMEKAVRQSFLKIQQILVDGIQRVYRSQGVGIADKHLEIIVRQMTSKVKIVHGGQTGFFAGEIVDLEFVERINTFLMIKIRYEPIVLGITRASLEVDSFLSAASFQQTTKVLTKAAIENKKDFLKGLKENLLVGNLLPAGTGYVLPAKTATVQQS